MTEPSGFPQRLERCARLFGLTGLDRLRGGRVAVIGLGGVGSFAAEGLARSGVGRIVLVDHDVVAPTNLNRQLEATVSALGRRKADVLRERLLDVAPDASLEAVTEFFAAETAASILDRGLDWVVDAIDSRGPKVTLLHACQTRALPVITALGAGGRLDPTRIRVGPLAMTRGDPLGAQVRKRLRRLGSLDGVVAAYTDEPGRDPRPGPWLPRTEDLHRGRQRVVQPSAVMVPAAMGMAIAAHVVRAILGEGS
ncbi:MAG: tRNA threonylcarbamoyladenosine dehydratase [Polyangiaceae bacterium]|nr:tRNA threonylcarbamoyladenosine dehydratase [Polyangiaceae bacterium]